jgi:hypothetical protein
MFICLFSIGTVHDIEDELDLTEFVPHFQRVKISGQDNTGVSTVQHSIYVLFSYIDGEAAKQYYGSDKDFCSDSEPQFLFEFGFGFGSQD